jgi:hypothetical protein
MPIDSDGDELISSTGGDRAKRPDAVGRCQAADPAGKPPGAAVVRVL